MRTTILVVTSLAAAACGGNPLDPGAGSSLGSGTHTLAVEGGATAVATTPNAGDASSYTTHFDLRLTRDQAVVNTGTVTVSSNGGDVALTLQTDGLGNGAHWTGDQPGYFEVYELNVTAGTDTISGVVIDGPDLHTFMAPSMGATVDASMPLAITWARNDHADNAVISTDQLDHVAIDDSGSYSLAAGGLKSSKDKAVDQSIELVRANQVAPAGAVTGSTVSVSVRNRVDVVAAINPNAP